ncbi:MAG: fibronectin type III domain-containing protein, partial [Candidatus Bipolaricaulis sp.]|nr:fibronectin type III domain-containing protein [Candidatus Bipolaricaulis sp.]
MTAPAYESFSYSKQSTADNNLTIPVPYGTEEGDLLIAFIVRNKSTIYAATCSGFTHTDHKYNPSPAPDSAGVTCNLLYKYASASEGSSTFVWGGEASDAFGFIIRLSNSTFYGYSRYTTTVDSIVALPSVLTPVDNCIVLRLFAADDDDVYIYPGIGTGLPMSHTGIIIDESGSSGDTVSGGAAYKAMPLAGSTGYATFALTAVEENLGYTLVIKPAATPPTPDPMTFSSTPAGVSSSSTTMTASEATHPTEDVEYYFTCTAGGGADSGWQADRTYAPSGLTADTQYTYTVKARSVTSQDETAESSGASAYTYPSAPAAPTSVAATRASSSQINLSWTKASGATGYDIYRKTGSGGSWGLLISLGDVASYNNSGLSSNTTYYYKIKSKKTGASSGLTSYSDYSTPDAGATTTAAPTPNPATFSSAPAPVSSTSVTMTATTASHPLESVEYLFICTTDGSKSSSWQANPTYTPNTLSPSIQYTFTVKTRTAVSQIEGTASSGASAYTYPTAPAAPTALTPTVVSNTRIDLSWTKSSGATGYQIYRKVGAGAYSLFDTVGDVAAYENSGLTPGVTYYYKLKALTTYAPSGLTSYSDYCDEVSAATTTIPSPDPMTFSSAPTAVDSDEITMTASLATAPDSVE